MGEIHARRDRRAASRTLVSILTVAVAIGSLSGCALFSSSSSISDSSGSFSDSSGSSSDSSTSSSGNGDRAYREDIRSHTIAVAEAGGTPDDLRRGVSEIALAVGISDWEALDLSWQAMALGLQEADLSNDQRVAYRMAMGLDTRDR